MVNLLNFTARKLTFILVWLTSAVGCAFQSQSDIDFGQLAQEYFEVHAQRSDFQRFMAFYAPNAQLQDIVYGNDLSNKTEIHHFLNWNKGEFQLLSGSHILTISQQIQQANIVVTQGYFHAFTYDGDTFGPWLFTIILEFDESGKIIKQTDWINYTPKEMFLGGQNMNNRIINDR